MKSAQKPAILYETKRNETNQQNEADWQILAENLYGTSDVLSLLLRHRASSLQFELDTDEYDDSSFFEEYTTLRIPDL